MPDGVQHADTAAGLAIGPRAVLRAAIAVLKGIRLAHAVAALDGPRIEVLANCIGSKALKRFALQSTVE